MYVQRLAVSSARARIRAALVLFTAVHTALCARAQAPAPEPPRPPGMVWIPGGEFTMGSDDERAQANERPAHRVRVDGFWMDETAVTNAQFRAFVDATRYVTIAERPVDWEAIRKQLPDDAPKPPDDQLQPGSLVFTPPDREVPLDQLERWWSWTIGASWRHPEGPHTDLAGKDEEPVVHVAWDDAVAYATWAKKRLPTEAEWERAARGGVDGKRFVWGDEFMPKDAAGARRHRANTFQGRFPHRGVAEDGYLLRSPVRAFPPNAYGLHDMAGNVWNWCSDLYSVAAHEAGARGGCCDNPPGPAKTWDPGDPHTPVKRVIKGGSFLCNVSYCESYRPSARRGTPPDTGSSHVGFRCVMTAAAWEQQRGVAAPQQAAPLPSWHDGAARSAIVAFVARITKDGSPDFVPPAQRVAVFDNDGTLWAEQPMYFQLAFAIDRVREIAPRHPEWKEKEPFASLLAGNVEAALAGGEKSIVELIAATHAGMTTDEFAAIVDQWAASAKHPKTGRLYTRMTYQPMRELLDWLRANGFKTYIVSGGGVEFMRPWAERVYGIPPEQVIGSRGRLKLEVRDGQPVIVKLPGIDHLDDGPGKPVGIQQMIGRRPIAAFGNSDGDLQMLQWTTAGPGARFALIVRHTDAAREWAYDRQSHVGKLDRALDEATARGWTVVDMQKDWKTIFPE